MRIYSKLSLKPMVNGYRGNQTSCREEKCSSGRIWYCSGYRGVEVVPGDTKSHRVGFHWVCYRGCIQVASYEQALIKTNRKPIQNHQSKIMVLFKTYTLEFEFGRHFVHIVSYHGMQSGFPVLLVGESALARFYAKMTVRQSVIFYISPTKNIKNRSYLDRI